MFQLFSGWNAGRREGVHPALVLPGVHPGSVAVRGPGTFGTHSGFWGILSPHGLSGLVMLGI